MKLTSRIARQPLAESAGSIVEVRRYSLLTFK
jgi:hypothetical protein